VSASAISDSIREHADSICQADGDVHFITSLPAKAASDTAAAPPTAPSPLAEPVEALPTRCQIDIEGSLLTLMPGSGPAPRVNGEAITRATSLRAGDIIQLDDGAAWKLVPVGTDDGSQT
jgi:hypothetical protein